MSNRPHEVLTRDRLIEVLDYDEETGIFKWKKKLSSRGVVGKIAGTTSYGYSAINIDGVRYFSHRLAWLYFYGSWPNQEIDHIDRNRKNNAIKNLRDVNRVVNALNTGNRTDSTSGIKGSRSVRKEINGKPKSIFQVKTSLLVGLIQSMRLRLLTKRLTWLLIIL